MPLRFSEVPQVAVSLASKVTEGEFPPDRKVSPHELIPGSYDLYSYQKELFDPSRVEAALRLLVEKGVLTSARPDGSPNEPVQYRLAQ